MGGWIGCCRMNQWWLGELLRPTSVSIETNQPIPPRTPNDKSHLHRRRELFYGVLLVSSWSVGKIRDVTYLGDRIDFPHENETQCCVVKGYSQVIARWACWILARLSSWSDRLPFIVKKRQWLMCLHLLRWWSPWFQYFVGVIINMVVADIPRSVLSFSLLLSGLLSLHSDSLVT